MKLADKEETAVSNVEVDLKDMRDSAKASDAGGVKAASARSTRQRERATDCSRPRDERLQPLAGSAPDAQPANHCTHSACSGVSTASGL